MSDGGGILRDLGKGRYRIEHPLAVNAKDGSLLVYVPEGEFEMGDGRTATVPSTGCTCRPIGSGVLRE